MILAKRPDIDRFLAKPDPAIRCAVIYGRDRGVARERADILAKRFAADLNDPFNVALLADGDLEDGGARLEGELQALSMTGGQRLIRVRLSGEKAGPDKTVAAAVKTHAEGGFNADAFLVVEAGALGRESALRKAAEKAAACAVIPCYEDEAGDVARLVREGLAADNVSLTGEALDLFVARLPRERGVARAEIERLALFIGPGSGRSLGAEELQDFLGVEPEASLFDAASDAFGGRAGPAQAGLRRALAEGETGPAVVRAVGMHAAKLRRAAVLTRAGADPKEAAKAAGVFWKQEREFLRQASRWAGEQLDAVQADILEADRACKRAGSPDSLLSERLLMSVAMKAKRLGL